MFLQNVFCKLLLVLVLVGNSVISFGQKEVKLYLNSGVLLEADSLIAAGDYYQVYFKKMKPGKPMRVFPEDIFKIDFTADSTLWFYEADEDELNRFEMQSFLHGTRDADSDFKKWPWYLGGGAFGFATGYATGSFLLNIPASVVAGFAVKLFPAPRKKADLALHDNAFYDKGYRSTRRKRRLPIVVGSSLIGGIFGSVLRTATDK